MTDRPQDVTPSERPGVRGACLVAFLPPRKLSPLDVDELLSLAWVWMPK